MLRLTEANALQEEAYGRILDRLLNLRLDTLVNTAFTPEGLMDHLQNDTELRQELGQGQWGVIRLDGRFVKYINTAFGTLTGDQFLADGGAEITAIADGIIRRSDRRHEDRPSEEERRRGERRQGYALSEDIIIRQGGDEFALIIRNVTPEELKNIAERIQEQLTVERALQRYSNDYTPFIASVGFAHAIDKELRPHVEALLRHGAVWQAYRQVNGAADAQEQAVKEAQYEDMWDRVKQMTPRRQRLRRKQPNDRVVAEAFLYALCPDFQEDPIGFLTRQKG